MASSGLSVPLFTISSKVSVKHIPIVDLRYSSNVAILRHRTRSEPITHTLIMKNDKKKIGIGNWKLKMKNRKWVKDVNDLKEERRNWMRFERLQMVLVLVFGVELVILLLLLRLVCTFGLRRNFGRRDLGLFIP